MTRFMNDYDLHFAGQRFDNGDTPNRLALVGVVSRLADWANANSDGWAYWPKPVRAAARAIEQIESRTSRENDLQEREDITEAELVAAIKPIKAFLTRVGVGPEWRDVILYSPTAVS